MRKLFYLIFTTLVTYTAYAQPAQDACNQAAGFCTGTNYSFPNSTGVPSYGGNGPYSCLGSTPNPVWYYMEVDRSGKIVIRIEQTSNSGGGLDVDYVLWGPFDSLAEGCANYGSSNAVSCSYSTAAVETVTINNAVAGKIYILLITNYSNRAGGIKFTQTNSNASGSGSTNCDVLCNIRSGVATPGACNPATGTYSLSGSIETFAPPTAGTLTITSSCGGSQTFSPPFSPTQSFSFTGLTANGQPCSVTASYSEDPLCKRVINYNAPAACFPPCPVTASNTGPYCLGSTIQLNAAGTGTSYSWTGPNGFTSTLQNPTIPSAAVVHGGTYTVTIRDGSCSSTSSTTVVVNDPKVSVTPASSTVCSGSPTALTVTPVPAAASYSWTVNPTSVSGAVSGTSPWTQQTLETTTANSGSVQYTFTPTLGSCTGTPVSVTVSVGKVPVLNAGNDTLVCEGSMVRLNATGTDFSSVQWSNGVDNGQYFIPSGTASYYALGTSPLGCVGGDTIHISVVTPPNVDFMPDVSYGCVPLEVNFISIDAQGMIHNWSFGNGTSSAQQGIANTVYANPGCYNVSLTLVSQEGCINTRVYDSLICVYPNPVAEFTPNPRILEQSQPNATMVNTSSGGVSYEWNFGDGSPVSTLESPTHAFPGAIAGSYEVWLIVTSVNGCVDSTKVNVTVQDEIIYYVPNAFTPDEDEFNPVFKPVFTNGFDPHDYTLSIYNRWGEMVFQSFDVNYGWDGTYRGSSGRVQDGAYTWKIEFKTTRSDERKVITGTVNLIR